MNYVRKIKKNPLTGYAIIGLGLTVLGFIVNLLIELINILFGSSNTGLLSLLILVASFIIGLVLLGWFANPILLFFGYKVVKK